MKTLFGMCVLGVIVTAVMIAEVVRLFVAAAPYVLVFAVVFGVLRARERRATAGRDVRRASTRPMPASRHLAAPPTGWVLMPVWVGPPRAQRPVIDAEVLNERWEPT